MLPDRSIDGLAGRIDGWSEGWRGCVDYGLLNTSLRL
jgi:hypothetical protein